MKIERAIISKDELDAACICINRPKMTQVMLHLAKRAFASALFVSVFGEGTDNALVMSYLYEQQTKNILCGGQALLCSAVLISVHLCTA